MRPVSHRRGLRGGRAPGASGDTPAGEFGGHTGGPPGTGSGGGVAVTGHRHLAPSHCTPRTACATPRTACAAGDARPSASPLRHPTVTRRLCRTVNRRLGNGLERQVHHVHRGDSKSWNGWYRVHRPPRRGGDRHVPLCHRLPPQSVKRGPQKTRVFDDLRSSVTCVDPGEQSAQRVRTHNPWVVGSSPTRPIAGPPTSTNRIENRGKNPA
jgi:hypothetical protein